MFYIAWYTGPLLSRYVFVLFIKHLVYNSNSKFVTCVCDTSLCTALVKLLLDIHEGKERMELAYIQYSR